MKNFLSMLFGAIIAFSAANCFATVPNNEIALGGIHPGMTASELINIAGQPVSRNADGNEWFYKGFKVEFDDDSPNFVEEIKTRQNSLSTPSGIFVGYADSILTETYGTADKVKRKHNAIVYTYYSADYSREMKFEIVNGVIVEITCEMND
mgnify:CR=1 FL=1